MIFVEIVIPRVIAIERVTQDSLHVDNFASKLDGLFLLCRESSKRQFNLCARLSLDKLDRVVKRGRVDNESVAVDPGVASSAGIDAVSRIEPRPRERL